MSAAHFIAIDLGASGGRIIHGVLAEGRFEMRDVHRFPNEPVDLAGDLHWVLPRLWHEVKVGLRAYGREGGEPLAGIGVATWGVDYGLLGSDGRLLANPYCYRDGRTADLRAQLTGLVPERDLYAATGIPYLDYNTSSQLVAARQRGEAALAAAETLLLLPDLFHYLLCGERVAETTMASTTQLLDARSGEWSGELCRRLGIEASLLPPLVPPGTVLGCVSPSLATELGLSPETPVVASAAHDTASAVAAIPELGPGDCFLSSGSWSLLGVETDEPLTGEGALAVGLSNERGAGGRTLVMRNLPGLWALEECRRHWARGGDGFAWDELSGLAEAAPPFSYLVDPTDGAFTQPGDMPARIAAYCARTGQAAPSDPGAVVRGYLESLALAYRRACDDFERVLGERLTTIRVVGGGSRNALLNQLTADACGREVVAGPAEATALGNMLVQAVATGHLRDLEAGREVARRSVGRERFVPQVGDSWEAAAERLAGLSEA